MDADFQEIKIKEAGNGFLTFPESPVAAFGQAGKSAVTRVVERSASVYTGRYTAGYGRGTPTTGPGTGPERPICHPLPTRTVYMDGVLLPPSHLPGYPPPSHGPGTKALGPLSGLELRLILRP